MCYISAMICKRSDANVPLIFGTHSKCRLFFEVSSNAVMRAEHSARVRSEMHFEPAFVHDCHSLPGNMTVSGKL